ncbi:MAG TPA: sigma 54-interacting transcriptional regulator [Candidatus Competibacteraceae bacterium]|nr:sigma 54-interacting transcriptional regulator [Candidatus Competibacteraceae bacterium]
MQPTLHDSAERYRQIFTYSNDAIFVIDPAQDQIIEANPRACAMLGYSREELLTTPISGVHPNEMSRMLAFAMTVLNDGHGWTNELSCLTKNGQFLPAEISASVIEIEGRSCIIAMVRDVAERRRMEAALQESQAWLTRVLDSAMDAIIALDEQGCVTLFNHAAEGIFHCPAAAVLGLPLARLVSERFQQLLELSMQEFARSDWKQHYMWAEGLTAFRADGEAFPVDTSLSPFKLGEKRYLTLILRDATIRQRAEQKLEQLQQENARLHAVVHSELGFTEMIGASSTMRRLLDDLEQVAATDATVLILGETGTGKELIARSVHQLSHRQDQVMVTVNCAALSAGLFESELFGHEKGAFTGAIARKPGRFELANRGTLFLDEVGELPLDLQAKLLRVLQEGEFERVGGATVHKVDVRLIAATNRDLRKAVAEGAFRKDLYYRLCVFPIAAPPLRERQGDIPLLTHYFVAKYSKKIGRPVETISSQVLDALTAYAWPGNVRELEHVIERGVILSRAGRLDPGNWLPRTNPLPLVQQQEIKTLDAYEREHILEALQLTDWKVSGPQGAAKLLGIKPTTLNARMSKLGIVRPR